MCVKHFGIKNYQWISKVLSIIYATEMKRRRASVIQVLFHISHNSKPISTLLHKLKEMENLPPLLKFPTVKLDSNLRLDGFLLIVVEGEFRETTNGRSLEVEHIGNGAASQADKRKKRASPLVAQTLVHLLCEQNCAGTPDRPDEGLGCESRCCLMLVRINWRKG